MRGDEGDEADRAGGRDGDAGEHDRGGEQRQPRALDADAERAGEVVAELERVGAAGRARASAGQQQRERGGERPDLLPAAAVDRADEPDVGLRRPRRSAPR